jgi:hypothetical protein
LRLADVARLLENLREQGIGEEQDGRIQLRVGGFDPEAVPLDREARRRAYERSSLSRT